MAPFRTKLAPGGPLTARKRTLVALGAALAVAATLVAVPAGAAPVAPLPVQAASPDVDPGAPGPLAVDELSYDLGDEAFAPEGFGAAVEVRGKVYAPASIAGRAPLVVLQHGRHATCAAGDDVSAEWPCPAERPEIPSYQGYDALGRLLASHGALVVSIGANGVNANDFASADGGASARGQLVLEHLRLWQQWDAFPDGPFGARFLGRVDLQRVGLMGHSRGGEGVVAAAEINRGRGSPFGIAAVSTLAPVDFARRVLPGVPLQVVLPYCDGDVFDLQGAAYYDDSRYAVPGDENPKQTTLLYGANHNFFNTVWTAGPGSFDDADFFGGPGGGADGCAPGGPGRLPAADQSAAGAAILGAFLRRYSLGDEAMAPAVTGVAAFPPSTGNARWAVAFHGGPRLDVARWADGADVGVDRRGRPVRLRSSSSGLVCDAGAGSFFGAPGLAGLPPCPGSEAINATNQTGVLDLGWTRPTATLAAGLDLGGLDVSAFDGLRFRLAVPPDSRNERRGRQDLSVRLTDGSGAQASVAVAPATNAVSRLPVSEVVHSVLNGVRLPLSAFAGVDLTRLTSIEVRADRTGSGRVLLNDLAFTAEGTGDRTGPTAGPDTPAPVVNDCRRGAARQWACVVGAVAWGREPAQGRELGGIAFAFSSPSVRRVRMAQVMAGPLAARPVVGRIGQLLFEDGYREDVYELALARSRGRWEEAITRLAEGAPFASGRFRTPEEVVDLVYRALVGRAPSAAARDYWADQVGAGRTYRLARSLLASAERAGRVVDDRYRQILGRSPDGGGRDYWVGVVRRTGGEQRMVASLLGSSEHIATVTG